MVAGLANILEGTAWVIEYIFASVARSFSDVTTNIGTNVTNNPGMAGFALSTGGLMTALVIYLLVKGVRRVLSGLACIALAMVLLGASMSTLLIAYSPSHFDPYAIATNLTNFTNFTNSSGSASSGVW